MEKRTMLQGFEWNLPADSGHWRRLEEKAAELEELGFTDVWLPPAYKGFSGVHDVGYGVYDLYGIPEHRIKPVKKLERMLQIRQKYAWGEQKNYFNHPNRIAWTRGSGMVVVMSNTNVEVCDSWSQDPVDDGEWICFGKPGQVFVDLLGNRLEEVTVGDNGWAKFLVGTSSVSVWVPKE